jgi:hypothetical protein
MDAVYYRSVSMGAEAAVNAVFSSRTRNIIDGSTHTLADVAGYTSLRVTQRHIAC